MNSTLKEDGFQKKGKGKQRKLPWEKKKKESERK